MEVEILCLARIFVSESEIAVLNFVDVERDIEEWYDALLLSGLVTFSRPTNISKCA